MAIVWVRRDVKSWSGTETTTTDTFKRDYLVLTDDIDDGPETVLAADDLPALYTAYSDGNDSNANTVITNREPRRDTNAPLLWHVSITYTVLVDESGEGGAGDIESVLPQIRMWFVNYTTPTQKDKNGDPIDNSAGELFDPAVQMDDCHLAIEIVRNELTPPFQKAQQFQNCLNKDAVWGVQPGLLKMMNIGGTRKIQRNVIYWEVKYEVHYKKDGWEAELLDQGFLRNAGANGEPISQAEDKQGTVWMLDKRGLPCAKPQLLDGAGNKLEGAAAVPVFLAFDLYPSEAFAPLQLPNILL